MNHAFDPLEKSAPAGGQTLRLPGSTRDAALHDQLYRYAEDLQQMVDRHGALETHYEALRESSARLVESRAVLDGLMQSSSDIHIVTDGGGRILVCNPASAVLAPPRRLAGSNLQEWVLPAHHERVLALMSCTGQTGSVTGRECELRLRREDHAAPPLIVSAQALAVLREGEVRHLHWVMRDMTLLRETEFESLISSVVLKSAAEGVMVTDIEGGILAVNRAFSQITGYGEDEVIGRNPRLLGSGQQDASFYTDFWRALREKSSWQGEVSNRRKNGEIYPAWMTVNAACDADGGVLSYIAVFADLSRLRKAENRLADLAYHDTLTGLPNRLLFEDRLVQTVALARRFDTHFTLIFIDLDQFKKINDTHGHAVGDRVLQEAGKRLTASVREVDTVARLSGDEFVVLAPGLAGDADIGLFCSKVLAALMQPVCVDSLELCISASFGCAEYPRHAGTEAALLKCADAAMYRAKAAGGNRHAVFDSGATPAA